MRPITQDEKRFQDFYNKYFKLAMHTAIKFTKGSQESEELVNDCFVGVWLHWQSLPHDADRLNYLQRSVRNRCISAIEKQHATHVVELTPHHFDREVDLAEINAFVITAIAEKVRQCINKLPKQRRIIMELIVSGKTNQEIGIQLGISNKTVHAVKALCMPKLIKLALQ